MERSSSTYSTSIPEESRDTWALPPASFANAWACRVLARTSGCWVEYAWAREYAAAPKP